MKTLSILILLLVLGACREEEGIWDSLSEAEKEALRLRASQKCIGDEQDDIDDIISQSNRNLSDMRRLDTWEITSTKDSTTLETNKIHVFKQTPTHVYFLYRQSDSLGTFSKFIKVPIAQNTEQYTDLQRKKCSVVVTPTLGGDPRYTSASLSSSTFTGNIEKERIYDTADTYYIETLTNTYSREFPAVFGILSKTRVKKTYNKNNNSVKSTETYKWAIKRVDDINSLSTDYTTFGSPRFCVAKYRPASSPSSPIYYPIPGLDENALNCDGDANGDGISDFNPAVDLI